MSEEDLDKETIGRKVSEQFPFHPYQFPDQKVLWSSESFLIKSFLIRKFVGHQKVNVNTAGRESSIWSAWRVQADFLFLW